MTMKNFIPTIWSKQLLFDFRQKAIAANLVNREYEGEAKSGNAVRVSTGGAIEIKDYKAGVLTDAEGNRISRTTAPDQITATHQDILIDQEKSFDFLVDDIDKVQAAGSLSGYTQSAAEGLAEDADRFILANIVGARAGLTPSAISTGDQAWDIVRDLRKALNKTSTPAGGRVLLCNAEFGSLLLSANSKLTDVDRSGSPAGLRDASIGRLLGFDTFESELLPVTSKPQVAVWHRNAFAYINQVEETESMRDQNTFSDRVRGLHVYGAKAVRPLAIASWTAS